jgi:uncharacterized flavoprotein (TIGR03862 family)
VNNIKYLANKRVAVIGGGPAGLMAAEVLSQANVKVDLYDAMPTVGRKFLMAGKGGMNITHSAPFVEFLTRYGEHSADLEPILHAFSPVALREWIHQLGINTFIGSSGRVFPSDMKAAPLLRAWLRRLRQSGVDIHTRHLWVGWSVDNNINLVFQSEQGEQKVNADAVVFALGGASWPQLGSTGEWCSLFHEQDIPVKAFKPSNCGFEVAWTEHFNSRYEGQPLKSIQLTVANAGDQLSGLQGEFIVTESGIEGGLIYTLSAYLRDEINRAGSALIYLDLMPDREFEWLVNRLSGPRRKDSQANFLRKSIGIDGLKAGLLRELVPKTTFSNPSMLGSAIKALPIHLLATRPIAEAISCAGGVPFSVLDENLMINSHPGVFCAGEMLDWEAPTGGYLLTACFASGRHAGLGVLDWLKAH